MFKLTRLVALLVLASAAVQAQSYPTRPITMVVPFAAGGATDVIARIVAEGMSNDLGQRVIVENAGGAGGTTGSIRAMRAEPDGYTILAGHMGTHGSAFSLYAKPKYDPRTDFEPIGLAASAPIVLFTRKDFPAKDVQEFGAYLREKGDAVKAAHSGIGSNAHLTCLLLSQLVGARPTEVAYRGNGPLMTDLLSGVVDFSCDQVITVAPQVTTGAVKALMTASATRSAAVPDVPTSTEAGLAQYQVDAWTAIFAPAKTPEVVLQRLNQAYAKALEDPRIAKRLVELGAVVPPAEQRTRAHLGDVVAAEVKRWQEVLSKTDVKLE